MSGTHGASLNVTKHTTAADLQIFADKLGAGDRLRGRKVEGGYELYAKSGKPGLWSRMTGRSAETRGHARDAIKMAFNNTERNLGGKTLQNVRTAMDTGIRSKDIKGDTLKALAAAADRTLMKTRNEKSGMMETKNVLDNRGPSLKKVMGNNLEGTASAIATRINNLVAASRSPAPGQTKAQPATMDDFAKEVAAELSSLIDDLKKDQSSFSSLDKLALSSGSAFKYDLRKELARNVSGIDTEFGRQVIDKAFDQISSDLLRNEEQSTGSIMIDGALYTKGSKLGEGGFGVVHEYINAQDGSTIALKTALNFDPDDANSINAFKHEANIHRAATGGNPANVVNFVGAVKMGDGQIGVAVSVARHGSAEKATDKISLAVQNQAVLPNDAMAMRISLLKDMAAGLNNLKTANGEGVVHFDFKRDNVFIDANGVGLVGDFGLSAKANKFDFGVNSIPQNKMQTSPELIKSGFDGKRDAFISAQDRSLGKAVTDRFKGLDAAQKNTLVGDCTLSGGNIANRRKLDVSAEKIDSWALGYAAFVTMFGREPLDDITGNSTTDQTNRLRSFEGDMRAIDVSVDDGSRTDWAKQTTGAFAGKTGNDQVDALINGLMHPDPNQRMTVAEASTRLNSMMTDLQSTAARQSLATLLSAPQALGTQPPPTPPAQPQQQAAQPQPASVPSTTQPPGPSTTQQAGTAAPPDLRAAHADVMQQLKDIHLAMRV